MPPGRDWAKPGQHSCPRALRLLRELERIEKARASLRAGLGLTLEELKAE